MRAELISLRSRAEGKQSSERLTTSSLWRNTSTLESLISFSRWGSEWIFSVCFLKTWLSLSVFPGEQSTAERSQCLSRPLVVIGRAVIYHERWREVTGQRPQSPGGLFNHREWALIPPLNTKFELLPEHHAVTQLTVSSLPQVARFSLWTLLHVITTQRCCWTGQTQTQTSTWTYRSWWCLQLLPSLISNFKIRILNVYFFSHFPELQNYKPTRYIARLAASSLNAKLG